MITREEALKILSEENTPEGVVEHSEAVARKALKTAEKIIASGHGVDLLLVETGALLHDIGRSQTHGTHHAYIGGLILRSRGLKAHALIAERHIGAGLTKHEAKRLGLPPKEFVPETIEEKIVANADNLVDGIHGVQIWVTVQKLRDEGVPEESVERVIGLYHEIESLSPSS